MAVLVQVAELFI